MVLLARVLDADGALLTPTTCTAITYQVYDKNTGDQIGTTTTATVADVLFASLQTDSRWTRDTTGYNLAIALPASALPAGGTTYRVEAKLTTNTGGDPFYLLWELQATDVYGH